MKNRMIVLMLVTALLAPTASLWASAGDATTQGPNGTTTGTSHSGTKKHHGKHHHKKPQTSSISSTSGVPGTK